MTTMTINATELTKRLTGTGKTLTIKTGSEQANIKKNLKNSVKLQLAIAYLFHDETRAIGDLTIDLSAGMKITENTVVYTIDDSVLDKNVDIPITGKYQDATDSNSKLEKNTISPDGNYDGFFSSMFDGKSTSRKSKKVGKKGNKRSR